MSENGATPYRVLARKYRPTRFSGLIGQDALVRTVTNAIATGRLAHAYLLTGVRGVGKTSTARIIARALNCVGPDGTGGPTADPCGACEHCASIAEDRHVDVIEMDAASRTGVADIRELIEGVRYRPVSARYKVYIIDEVHMLSGAAFNALLKTLEEPPPHVIFVFATTEVRKLPVTVLSRCQRFDLMRVEMATLAAHFADIAAREGVTVEPAALAVIARAADGSVRDGLSLLDRAIAHAGTATDQVGTATDQVGTASDQVGTASDQTGASVTEAGVRDMLGLVDRVQIIDLFDLLMQGAIREALERFDALYAAGAEPAVVLQDLLEFCHWLTRHKLAPAGADDPMVPEAERLRGRAIADSLTMPVLTRTWQMLLKGLEETRQAMRPAMAVEMALVRIAHAADLPTPAEALRALRARDGDAPSGQSQPVTRGSAASGSPAAASPPAGGGAPTTAATTATHAPRGPSMSGAAAPAWQEPEPVAEAAPVAPSNARIRSFADVIARAAAEREGILAAWLRTEVSPVRMAPGQMEINCGAAPNKAMLSLLGARLSEWTGERWMIALSEAPGEPTITQQEKAAAEAARAAATSDPLVRMTLDLFPDARVRAVRPARDDENPNGDRSE